MTSGSSAGPMRKRPKLNPVEDSFGGGGGGGGLYDFLPPPDPVKDEAVKKAAEEKKQKPLPPEDRSRVIFLDIDGVLLPAGSVEHIIIDGAEVPIRGRMNETAFPQAAMDNLRKIVEKTGATIVLSSEWRRTAEMRDIVGVAFRTRDIPQLRESTVILKARQDLLKSDGAIIWCERRAREIGAWMKMHPEVTSWVALDDLDFSWADSVRTAGTPIMKCRSVLTDAVRCLTENDAAKAIKILLNPPNLTEDEAAAALSEAARFTQESLEKNPTLR